MAHVKHWLVAFHLAIVGSLRMSRNQVSTRLSQRVETIFHHLLRIKQNASLNEEDKIRELNGLVFGKLHDGVASDETIAADGALTVEPGSAATEPGSAATHEPPSTSADTVKPPTWAELDLGPKDVTGSERTAETDPTDHTPSGGAVATRVSYHPRASLTQLMKAAVEDIGKDDHELKGYSEAQKGVVDPVVCWRVQFRKILSRPGAVASLSNTLTGLWKLVFSILDFLHNRDEAQKNNEPDAPYMHVRGLEIAEELSQVIGNWVNIWFSCSGHWTPLHYCANGFFDSIGSILKATHEDWERKLECSDRGGDDASEGHNCADKVVRLLNMAIQVFNHGAEMLDIWHSLWDRNHRIDVHPDVGAIGEMLDKDKDGGYLTRKDYLSEVRKHLLSDDAIDKMIKNLEDQVKVVQDRTDDITSHNQKFGIFHCQFGIPYPWAQKLISHLQFAATVDELLGEVFDVIKICAAPGDDHWSNDDCFTSKWKYGQWFNSIPASYIQLLQYCAGSISKHRGLALAGARELCLQGQGMVLGDNRSGADPPKRGLWNGFSPMVKYDERDDPYSKSFKTLISYARKPEAITDTVAVVSKIKVYANLLDHFWNEFEKQRKKVENTVPTTEWLRWWVDQPARWDDLDSLFTSTGEVVKNHKNAPTVEASWNSIKHLRNGAYAAYLFGCCWWTAASLFSLREAKTTLTTPRQLQKLNKRLNRRSKPRFQNAVKEGADKTATEASADASDASISKLSLAFQALDYKLDVERIWGAVQDTTLSGILATPTNTTQFLGNISGLKGATWLECAEIQKVLTG